MRYLLLIIIYIYCIKSYAQVTYYDDVMPILNKHCVSCHSPKEIGPISLDTYDKVASYASMIQYVIEVKLMPPFLPETKHISFANQRSISAKEKEIISKWIDDGLLEGKPTKNKKEEKNRGPKAYDYTICMKNSFEHYGIYYDQYQAFVLPLDIPESTYVKDVFFQPGNNKIVRSATLHLAKKGSADKIDRWDPRYGFYAFGSLEFVSSFPHWANWMPHTDPLKLKKNERLYIPNDSEMIMQIHYGPYGEIQKDSSCVHFNFDTSGSSISQNVPLTSTDFLLDSFLLKENKITRINSSFVLPVGVSLKSITPVAYLLCRSWNVFAVLPDRSTTPLLSIPDWNFHWKEKFIFNKPIDLPSGTTIYIVAQYDNTISNPYNPSSPPHTMKAGPHMFDENYTCYFEFDSSQSSDGFIIKPFTTTEDKISEFSFYLYSKGKYEIILYELDSGERIPITNKEYNIGKHTIIDSYLPSKKGKYCINLEKSDVVIDSWWVIIY